jgi:hypothetical protein
MSLGYDRSLYMLTFDHRASFQKGLRRAVTHEAAATAAGASR